MRRRHVLLAGLLLARTPAWAQTASLRLGTTPEGGGFAPYSVALTETLKSVDHGLAIRAVDTKGSTDNAQRLKAGTIDIGLLSDEVFHESEDRDPGRLKIVSAMYYTPGMFAVLANSRRRTISDLRGQPVIWQPRGTGSEVQSRYIMDGLGLDPDRDFVPIYTRTFNDGPPLIFENRAAALWGSGLRLPTFVQIAEYPLGVRFIVPDAQEIARIHARHPFLVPLTVARGTYPGQSQPVTTVGSASFIVARADLDATLVTRLVAALYKAERLTLKSPYLAQTTAAITLASVPALAALHPAVLKFFRDNAIAP